MRRFFLLTLGLCFHFFSQGQSFSFTTASYRRLHDQRLVDSVIKTSFALPLHAGTEAEWQKAFWAAELMLYRSEAVAAHLKKAWDGAGLYSEPFQKALLEASYTLYPNAFAVPVAALLRGTASPAVFIRCAEYLLQAKKTSLKKSEIRRLLTQKFPDNIVGAQLLLQRLENKKRPGRPPLAHFFRSDFLPGETVVFSLQRSNRNYPGLVLIRKKDGSLLKNKDGSLFHTTQLARAVTGYPFYITNGNTPQGLFRWTGFDTSSNNYIGPTTNLQMVMPFETTPQVFFNDSSRRDKAWTKEDYAALLPPLWKDDSGIYESYWAGAMGRSEIIMHGTTINPAYYKGQPYFPHTPSLGCLCSYEEWDENGARTVSHQQQIVEALLAHGSRRGYVVVIDVNESTAPVDLEEILSMLPASVR